MISYKKIGQVVWIGLLIFVLAAVMPLMVHAQVITCTSPGIPTGCTPAASNVIQNPVTETSLAQLVADFLGIVLKIGIPVIALAIIYSGFVFISARGSAEKLEKAKTRLLYTLIGAGILLGAYMIATIIQATITAIMS